MNYLDKLNEDELKKELISVNGTIKNYANLLGTILNSQELDRFFEKIEKELILKKEIIKRLERSENNSK